MTTDAWDGRPENPERGDTWHWVQHGYGQIVPRWWSCSYWQAAGGIGGNIYPAEAPKAWPRYLGPCLTPDEVAAREAAAAEAMLGKAVERLYEIAGRHAASGGKRDAAVLRVAARTVASLPLPAPDALARALAQARAEGAELLAWLANACCDLRCVDEPTPGGDDGDVGWVVIEHHMSAPKEREVGYGKTPQEAIRAAIRARGKEGQQ